MAKVFFFFSSRRRHTRFSRDWSSDVCSSDLQRFARVIHYNLSYIVQGLEFGTDGAIVLLHDIVAGAFVWADVMPQLASLSRAVYAIDLLGCGESDHPWPADT